MRDMRRDGAADEQGSSSTRWFVARRQLERYVARYDRSGNEIDASWSLRDAADATQSQESSLFLASYLDCSPRQTHARSRIGLQVVDSTLQLFRLPSIEVPGDPS